MVRPSYVLGGRAMEIVYSDADLKRWAGAWGRGRGAGGRGAAAGGAGGGGGG